jgi:hypothetical protein
MSTATPHTAAEIMDRCAILMNDPDKTDYTYTVTLPYLNMAINELNEHLEEANVPITDQTFFQAVITPGHNAVVNPPLDLVEIQEVAERRLGSEYIIVGSLRPIDSSDSFIVLPRKEFTDIFPATDSLLFWCFQDNKIQFNIAGPTVPIQLRIKYIRRVMALVTNPEELIKIINAKSYLSYKTASLCSFFIGEDKERAGVLESQAVEALERMIGISNKGKQQIMTRHRPFRASWKTRGY